MRHGTVYPPHRTATADRNWNIKVLGLGVPFNTAADSSKRLACLFPLPIYPDYEICPGPLTGQRQRRRSFILVTKSWPSTHPRKSMAFSCSLDERVPGCGRSIQRPHHPVAPLSALRRDCTCVHNRHVPRGARHCGSCVRTHLPPPPPPQQARHAQTTDPRLEAPEYFEPAPPDT